MSEVLVEFTTPIASKAGEVYGARACGWLNERGLWEGWIEFLPAGGGPPLRSTRETTQPNREDTIYWATGLTPTYLEGALERTLDRVVKVEPAPAVPAFDEPARGTVPSSGTAVSVLNPFSVYRKGEEALRGQLTALSRWHLVNIILDYDLSEQDQVALSATPEAVLVELIVSQVRMRHGETVG